MGYALSAHRPLKRLGQNFLVDDNIALEIVSSADLTLGDTVLEPGSGYGTLTRLLEKEAGKVIAVEKDPKLADKLQETFKNHTKVVVVKGDVLRTPLPVFNKIVGTPPYYLSSKLLLFLTNRIFDEACLVFQKEFGERLTAEPGSAEYGRLTVTAQRSLHVEKVRDIPRNVFRPRPKVDSVLLKLTPKKARRLDEPLFEELVRGIFTQRRRLLRGALTHFLRLKLGRDRGRSIVEKMPIPDLRVYQLNVEQLENLCLQLSTALTGQTA